MCESVFGTSVSCIYSLISFFIASFGIASLSFVILDFSDGKLRNNTIIFILITIILTIVYNLKDIY